MSHTQMTLETIHSDEYAQELKVTFYPQLFLQRRIWILDVMRAEKVTKVLDIGCGEGQLLAVLCQPAPWLPPPPAHILPTLPEDSTDSAEKKPQSSSKYNHEIPNIHPTHIMGLDISSDDLDFAVQGTAPPQPDIELEKGSDYYSTSFSTVNPRWEDLDVKIWKGGLEVINEDFIDIECIVSSEVYAFAASFQNKILMMNFRIEHLSPNIFPAFAPVILGVYHPHLFLITTPSYTFNARFTAPMAPPSARKGYPDPTRRTDRVFRHSDHKFEWTVDEFRNWCDIIATDWGYEVKVSSVGRPIEVDVWGRDAELGGASSVAVFRRREMDGREKKGRDVLRALRLNTEPHELLAHHKHLAHTDSGKPRSLEEIGLKIKEKMEEFREGVMRVEELWFEQDIAVLCGGWIEILIRAVEQSDLFVLKKIGEGMRDRRADWTVELVGGVAQSKEYWSKGGDTGMDTIPFDWISGGEAESSEGEWGGSTDMDGDVSRNESEGEDDLEDLIHWSQRNHWEKTGEDTDKPSGWSSTIGWAKVDDSDISNSGEISTAGWDGDKSEDTS
ncbi:hypothetical protein C0995_010744 [Termitomyces sp. Mi166|nr:hypothetical protein C0995_010744 [Termitomyces sp. Mi166\